MMTKLSRCLVVTLPSTSYRPFLRGSKCSTLARIHPRPSNEFLVALFAAVRDCVVKAKESVTITGEGFKDSGCDCVDWKAFRQRQRKLQRLSTVEAARTVVQNSRLLKRSSLKIVRLLDSACFPRSLLEKVFMKRLSDRTSTTWPIMTVFRFSVFRQKRTTRTI